MSYDIDKDAEWYSEHQDELLQKYDGKIIAVRNGAVLAAGIDVADLASRVDLPVGEYLIQTCLFGNQANTVHIYTPGLVST